jgi:hypothetical protein
MIVASLLMALVVDRLGTTVCVPLSTSALMASMEDGMAHILGSFHWSQRQVLSSPVTDDTKFQFIQRLPRYAIAFRAIQLA